MKKNIIAGSIFCIFSFCIACSKHVYVMSYKELNNYAEAAKEPGLECFVVYINGDTLKGNELKKKHNKITGKVVWSLDGKEISIKDVHSYQDSEGYRIGRRYWNKNYYDGTEYARILKGDVSLFASHYDDSRLTQSYSSSTNAWKTKTTGGGHTTFYLQTNGMIVPLTYISLKGIMSDDLAAYNQMNLEFGEKGKPDRELNDYRALIRILNIYNRKAK